MTTEPLNQAAAARHRRTIARAERALRELDAEGAAISFQSVARRAGVSRQWLYTQPGLRQQIEALRDRGPVRTDSVPRGSALAKRRCASASNRCATRTNDYARRTTASRPSSRSPTASSATPGRADRFMTSEDSHLLTQPASGLDSTPALT